MNRSTFTQSGELVTISRLKNKEKWKFLRSLRFRITVILVIIGIVPCVILEKSIVNSYEDRAVSVRSITVKNQCDIICNQLIQQNYMEDPGSDVINGQLSMLTNIYGGRILIIDQDFRVIKDTYDMDRGKTIISQEVIQSFQGKETSQYDRKNSYLEMTVRIQNTETKETLGVMLVSISADEIRANMKILETKGMTILSIIALLVLVFGYLLAGILMKPFQKVTRSIEDITDGYLDESISVPDYLETELITDAFNKMLTRVRTLDDSRQEFVSNVSHELKTPLASMKVLADSLNGQEGVPVELYQEFMQDITSEIDRENQIITDLLSLVKMDKKVADLNITQVNINELLEQLLKRLHPIAAQKNVELDSRQLPPGQCGGGCDEALAGVLEPDRKRHQIQQREWMGACILKCGSQIFLRDGGRLRHRHPGGVDCAYLRAFLPRGQVPLAGNRRNRPWPCDCAERDCHAPGSDPCIQQRKRGNDIFRADSSELRDVGGGAHETDTWRTAGRRAAS